MECFNPTFEILWSDNHITFFFLEQKRVEIISCFQSLFYVMDNKLIFRVVLGVSGNVKEDILVNGGSLSLLTMLICVCLQFVI